MTGGTLGSGIADAEVIRILVVDDHPVVRDGLRGMLDGQPDLAVVGEAADGIAAMDQATRLRPDVILMDLRMPRLDGGAAIARITVYSPDVRILVLTTYDADNDIVRAMEAGAVGVLLKDTPREDCSERSAPPRAASRRSPTQ